MLYWSVVFLFLRLREFRDLRLVVLSLGRGFDDLSRVRFVILDRRYIKILVFSFLVMGF